MPHSPKSAHHLLVFGASGAIGASICRHALARGWRVTGVARTAPDIAGATTFALDPLAPNANLTSLRDHGPYHAVCWAQGTNINDSIYDLDLARHAEIYNANVTYILITLKALLTQNCFAGPSRLCILSSIWQNLARQTKLSYCISKAALQGLVLSAAADLASEGHLINAVLPGATDTPMTQRNLAPEQMHRLTSATHFNRLPSLTDVASLVCFLCSPENTGVTGQFVAADLGFSGVRLV